MRAPITATKLRGSLNDTRRSGRLRSLDPAPVVTLAIAADAAASTAAHDFALGRDKRTDQRVGELVRGLAAVPAAAAGALSNPRAFAWTFYRPSMALRLARATAIGIHLRCQGAFQDGREMRPQPPGRPLIDGIARFDGSRTSRLRALRRTAMAGDFDVPLGLAAELTAEAHSEIAPLCKLAGRASGSGDPRSAEVALKASDIARRHAALVAGAILIDQRLRDRSKGKSTAGAARRASKLRRTPLNPNAARRTLRPSDKGKRLAVVAQLGQIEFIERPRKPYSGAVAGELGELRVPHKNMRRVGVAQGSWVVAIGKVKVDGRDPLLEVEFEGPGQHSREFFEDWVFDIGRAAYDLYPGVLNMVWEFPDPKRRGGAADLYSRLNYSGD